MSACGLDRPGWVGGCTCHIYVNGDVVEHIRVQCSVVELCVCIHYGCCLCVHMCVLAY